MPINHIQFTLHLRLLVLAKAPLVRLDLLAKGAGNAGFPMLCYPTRSTRVPGLLMQCRTGHSIVGDGSVCPIP